MHVRECRRADGLAHGPGVSVGEGDVMHYTKREGALHGAVKLVDADGSVMISEYAAGERGRWIYLTGRLTLICEPEQRCHVVLTCPEGELAHTEAGTYREQAYTRSAWCEDAQGRRQGLAYWFGRHSDLPVAFGYVDGAPHGAWRHVDENLRSLAAGRYTHGTRVGPWTVKSGRVTWRGSYAEGVPTGEWTWTSGEHTGGGTLVDGEPVGRWILPCPAIADAAAREAMCDDAVLYQIGDMPGVEVVIGETLPAGAVSLPLAPEASKTKDAATQPSEEAAEPVTDPP